MCGNIGQYMPVLMSLKECLFCFTLSVQCQTILRGDCSMLPLSGLNILSANEQPLRYSQPIKCPNEPYILILLKGKSLGVENRYSLCHCLFRTTYTI
jgi:hypothetical protein